MLAERRLEHMTLLYETGRWRRYFSEERFLRIIRETKAAAELWQRLAPGQQQEREQAQVHEPAVQVFDLSTEPAFARTLPPPSPFEAEAQRSVA